MKPYDKNAKCPKCGYDWVTTRYCKGNGPSWGWDFCHQQDGGHLHRECQRCGYGWLEECMTQSSEEASRHESNL